MPQWSGNGRTLFFLNLGSTLISVDVTREDGDAFRVGSPKPLFELESGGERGSSFSVPFPSSYGITPDGRRFLWQMPTDDRATQRITVLVNWPKLLTSK
jgi:hypothetical protein